MSKKERKPMERGVSFEPGNVPPDAVKIMHRLQAASDFHAGFLAFLTRAMINKGVITEADVSLELSGLSKEVLQPRAGEPFDQWLADRLTSIIANISDDEGRGY